MSPDKALIEIPNPSKSSLQAAKLKLAARPILAIYSVLKTRSPTPSIPAIYTPDSTLKFASKYAKITAAQVIANYPKFQ
jgi:hypothetical protein